ncbi:hypothetical protein C8Q79DRAFT_286841 [Trametes meyenii]|nr:hypothetical protein C8Q79DRAFT_286841 [Trametes meyenii]
MRDDPMSSASDLTDLDEDDEVPLSRRSKKRETAVDNGYKIRGALKVPRATTFTCQSLYEQISSQDIDLQPEYQRAVVWPDAKQIGLIDSIFRNYYIPPVIFVVHIAEDGSERRTCVDGKQRLTSIYRFISGEIPHKDPFTGEKYVFTREMGNSKAQLLPERYRKIFMHKQIVCMEYQDITPENEREIFQRVQLGMALTPAERLQAIDTPLTKFIREVLDTYIEDRLATSIEWDTSRANDFRTLSAAIYSMLKWPKLNTLVTISAIEKWLHDSEELEQEFCEDVRKTFEVFCQLAEDPKFNKPFSLAGTRKVAPMEVLAIALLIHVFRRKLSLSQLSEAIELLRKDIRQTEKDVRQNGRTMKLVLAFLKDLNLRKLLPNLPPIPISKHLLASHLPILPHQLLQLLFPPLLPWTFLLAHPIQPMHMWLHNPAQELPLHLLPPQSINPR